jgi:hypothetical protein
MVVLLVNFFIVGIESLTYHWILRLYLLIQGIFGWRLRLFPLAESLLIDYSTLMIQCLLQMKCIVFQRGIAIIVLTLHEKILIAIGISGIRPLLILRLPLAI